MDEKKVYSILKEVFGYDEFRFEQKNIINSIIGGNDTLAIMPTGGGKSLCYQVPALYMDGITLVISPLISLMEDQVRNLAQFGIKSCYINSSLTFDQKNDLRKEILNGEHKLVYISPEGIFSSFIQNLFTEIDVSLIAVDEAHCVSQWGHEFRKDYMELHQLKDFFPDAPIIALTATADEKTRLDICAQLRLDQAKIYVSSFDRPNITYEICDRVNDLVQLQKFIKEKHVGETGIVYCLSRKKVEKVAAELKKAGLNAVPYHAGLNADVRKEHQERFNIEKGIIVVATIAFGMGIDRPDVRFVAHLDLPKSIESYYQETGRAGRDGVESSAWMTYGLEDVMKLSQMIERTDANEDYKKMSRHKLDRMLSLCETVSCRRHNLLSYFGEELGEKCNNCDTCHTPPTSVDASIDAQKLLSTIFKTGQRFGAGHIIDVLRGSQNAKLLSYGHDKLSVFGIGKDKEKTYWNSVIRQLLNKNHLIIKDWTYRNLTLTQSSISLIKGDETFLIREKIYHKEVGLPLSKKKHIPLELTGNQELFEALRSLRSDIASSNKVPPYIVFSDKTLIDMCNIQPRNDDEFLLVHGVGRSKLEKYGDDFLSAIKSF